MAARTRACSGRPVETPDLPALLRTRAGLHQFRAMISRSPDAPAARPRRHAGAAAREKARAALAERRAAAAALRRRLAAHRAEARERLAELAVAARDQQRHAEHARPQLPFGHDVVGILRGVKLDRERGIAMFEIDRDAGRRVVLSRAISRIETPRKAWTGTLSAMRMPCTARRRITRSGCSSTWRTRSSATASLAVKRTGSARGSSRAMRLDPAECPPSSV